MVAPPTEIGRRSPERTDPTTYRDQQDEPPRVSAMIEQLCASVGAPSMMRSPNELFMPAAEAVKQQGGQDLDGHRMSRAEDQSFRGIGIPSVFMAMGEQEANDALAACN